MRTVALLAAAEAVEELHTCLVESIEADDRKKALRIATKLRQINLRFIYRNEKLLGLKALADDLMQPLPVKLAGS